MSTRIDLNTVDYEGKPFRISLCASGACVEHLEIVRDGQCIEIDRKDIPTIRDALERLERFCAERKREKVTESTDSRLNRYRDALREIVTKTAYGDEKERRIGDIAHKALGDDMVWPVR